MAHRHFEGKVHALLYKKYRPVPPPQLINRIMSFIQEKPIGSLENAVDVGCGSGQSTTFFAPYFTKVIGTDISENMIQQANANNNLQNVTYKVSPAERIPVDDNSVQLITVSQAAHWFDLSKFYVEGRRVLSPFGVMAIFGYVFPTYRVFTREGTTDPTITAKNMLLQTAWEDFYHVGLRNCWDEKRKLVDYRYADFVIPYDDFVRNDDIFHEEEATVSDIGNYILTWSGYQTYCEKHGEELGRKLIGEFQNRIMETLGATTDPDKTKILKRISYFLLLGRTPSS